jgi:hypothetical protein
MRVRPTIPTDQLNGFLDLRQTSINHQARRIFDEFSRVEDLKAERKIGTIEAPVKFSISPDGGLTTSEYFTVELLLHRGYFVAHNSAVTFSENGQRITEPLKDELYEMIVPATPKFQFASGDLRHRIIKAIVKAVEPIPQGREIDMQEIILPLLEDREVKIIASIDDLPPNCRLASRHSISSIVGAYSGDNNFSPSLDRRLNSNHAVLIGPQHLSFFEQRAAA